MVFLSHSSHLFLLLLFVFIHPQFKLPSFVTNSPSYNNWSSKVPWLNSSTVSDMILSSPGAPHMASPCHRCCLPLFQSTPALTPLHISASHFPPLLREGDHSPSTQIQKASPCFNPPSTVSTPALSQENLFPKVPGFLINLYFLIAFDTTIVVPHYPKGYVPTTTWNQEWCLTWLLLIRTRFCSCLPSANLIILPS